MLRSISLLCLLLTGAATHASAQTIATSFEVASVKLHGSAPNGGIGYRNGKYAAENLTLRTIISNAYDVRTNDLVSGGPGWLDSARYDIEGKVDDASATLLDKMPLNEREAAANRMLRSLLEQRFALKVREGTKDQPIYEMVVAKDGFKPKPVDESTALAPQNGPDGKPIPVYRWEQWPGKIVAHAATMEMLATQLQGGAGRRVVDKTGISGSYAFTLTWSPEEMQNGNGGERSLFTALAEELGVRLQSAKAPERTLVVEAIEKPTEN